MNDLEILALDRGNMFHLYALHRSVYGSKKPKGYFEKKYDTSYLGLGAIGYLAVKDNVPLSFVGLIPAEFRIAGQRAIGVQSCDTMTDPRARGKGLATLLEQKAISTAKEQHIDFIYGFGNDDSVAWLTGKCGFSIAHVLNRYVVRSGRSLPRRLLSGTRTRFSGVFQQRAAFSQDERRDGMIYPEGFIDYKRVNGPFLAKISNTWLWLSRNKNLVGALFETEGDHPYEILRSAAQRFGKRSVTYMTTPGSTVDRQLCTRLTPEKGFTMLIKNLSYKHELGRLEFQLADCDIF